MAFLIQPTCMIPSTTAFPLASGNSDQLYGPISEFLHVYVPLDKRSAPVGGHLLGNQISIQFLVPHVAHIATELPFRAGGRVFHFQELDFTLLVKSQVEVLSEEKPISHVLHKFFDDFVDFFILCTLLLKR